MRFLGQSNRTQCCSSSAPPLVIRFGVIRQLFFCCNLTFSTFFNYQRTRSVLIVRTRAETSSANFVKNSLRNVFTQATSQNKASSSNPVLLNEVSFCGCVFCNDGILCRKNNNKGYFQIILEIEQ